MNEVDKIVRSFAKHNVLVIGDLILDIYNTGTPLGISAETPTLVVGHRSSRISYGGAGLLVRNILSLGGQVTFVSLVGDDDYSNLVDNFVHKNLQKVFFREHKRASTIKERFWVNGHKLLCWDRLDNKPISAQTEEKIIQFLFTIVCIFPQYFSRQSEVFFFIRYSVFAEFSTGPKNI